MEHEAIEDVVVVDVDNEIRGYIVKAYVKHTPQRPGTNGRKTKFKP